MNALTVWWGEQRVGYVTVSGTQLHGFRYDAAWRQTGSAISCSLPLKDGDDFQLPDRRGVNFFANLLPEGNARDRLVRRLGIADDDFRLLKRLGGDCAGALTLWPADDVRPSRTAEMRVLRSEELLDAIRLGVGSLLVAESTTAEAPRLSLAGAQDKLPVRVRCHANGEQEILLPQGNVASTHILKLPVNDLRHVPLYECYTTFMAARLGLPVAEIVPLRIGEHLCSLSTRYDRAITDKSAGKSAVTLSDESVTRIHQEDFCQALGRSRSEKYADSGAHIGLAANLIRHHVNAPARDLRALLQWQVFNALSGNTDGHLKNLSLLADEGGGWQLAPFYDLVCVLAIEGVSHRLALPVGDALDPQMLARAHWEAFAKQTGTGVNAVLDTLTDLADALHENLDAWHAEFQSRYGEFPALQRPHQVMRRQTQKALRDWRR